MIDRALIQTLFARYGVPLNDVDLSGKLPADPRAALTLLFANREVAARFDAAHGRPPEESDIDELLDMYETLIKRAP